MRAVSKENARPESIVNIPRLHIQPREQSAYVEQADKAIATTYLNIFQHREHEQIKLRVPPSDNHTRGRRSWEVIWPKYPQQSIAHEHIVILHLSLRRNLDGATVRARRRRDSRGADAIYPTKPSANTPKPAPSTLSFDRCSKLWLFQCCSPIGPP